MREKVDLHAIIYLKVKERVEGEIVEQTVETTVGRVLFNQVVPDEYGYINKLLTKNL